MLSKIIERITPHLRIRFPFIINAHSRERLPDCMILSVYGLSDATSRGLCKK